MKKNEKPLISLIVPVFNESISVSVFLHKVTKIFSLNKQFTYEIIFVNDGSTDNTMDVLLEIKKKYSRILIIDLSRNFGKEAALSAGLNYCKGDAAVPLDVDLQDPPELILDMFNKWKEGYDVVVARRINRDTDTFLKRNTSKFFYKLYNKMSDVKIPENVGDFRLMDRSVVNAIKELPESNRFMKGIFNWVGFKTDFVDYVRPSRDSGETKFSGLSLFKLAIDGITSFSSTPLRIWFYLGFIVAFLSLLFASYIIINKLFFDISTPGYASLAVLIIFFGGLQIMGIGVLGEYLGRNYIESKRRPVFIVRKIYK